VTLCPAPARPTDRSVSWPWSTCNDCQCFASQRRNFCFTRPEVELFCWLAARSLARSLAPDPRYGIHSLGVSVLPHCAQKHPSQSFGFLAGLVVRIKLPVVLHTRFRIATNLLRGDSVVGRERQPSSPSEVTFLLPPSSQKNDPSPPVPFVESTTIRTTR
jgi:hypothetical protein